MEWIKSNKKLILYAVIILVTAWFLPVEKNWTLSYSEKHNWPYGAEITRDIMQDLFPESEIVTSSLPMYNTYQTLDIDKQYLYFLIDRRLSVDSLELSSMLKFAEDGNSVFISNRSHSAALLDTLGLEAIPAYKLVEDGELQDVISDGISLTTEYIQHFPQSTDSAFHFSLNGSVDYFKLNDSVDTEYITIACNGTDSLSAYVRVSYGQGYFYLHNQPLLFTNYYLLQDDGKRYMEAVASYLPSYTVLWDENHKAIRSNIKNSPLHIILKQPSLKWAYWVSICGLCLYFLFRIKRRQRAIPIVKPPKNDSLDFATTMGALYYNSSTNKSVALKKIIYLKEYFSDKFRLIDIEFKSDEIEGVSKKSGFNIDETKELYQDINNIINSPSISSGQLKEFNRKVNKFLEKENTYHNIYEN